MEQVSENIKQEFESKLSAIEEADNNKKRMINNLFCVAALLVFIAVLSGTIMSVNNYIKAKQRQNNNVPVIELKKVN